MNNNCYIHGIGTHTPSRIVTNDDLSKIVDTNDEWISTRTGIKARHVLADDEQGSDLGVEAAKAALAEACIDVCDLTHVIVATTTPELLCSATSTIIAKKLGCGTNVMAFDFNAACSGFLYGLSLTQGILAANPKANILLVCTEALTRRVNWQDRASCVLFGDGAGSVVLRGVKEGAKARLENVICHSDGNLCDLITIGGGTCKAYVPGEAIGDDFFLHMQGREVFKHAVRNMTAVCHEVLESSKKNLEDVDLFIPHQANLRIIEAVGSRLSLAESKVFTNVQKYGNTSSASVPLALNEARMEGAISSGNLVLLCAVGAGFTWGAALVEFM